MLSERAEGAPTELPSALDPFDYIVALAIREFDIPIQAFYSKSRVRNLVDARRAVAVIAYRYLNLTIEKIAHHLGCDHSTISHHRRTHDELCETDMDYYERFIRLERAVRESGIVSLSTQSRRGSIKLTEGDEAAIIESYGDGGNGVVQLDIAREYGVSTSTVSKLVNKARKRDVSHVNERG